MQTKQSQTAEGTLSISLTQLPEAIKVVWSSPRVLLPTDRSEEEQVILSTVEDAMNEYRLLLYGVKGKTKAKGCHPSEATPFVDRDGIPARTTEYHGNMSFGRAGNRRHMNFRSCDRRQAGHAAGKMGTYACRPFCIEGLSSQARFGAYRIAAFSADVMIPLISAELKPLCSI